MPYCVQCGTQVQPSDVFCARCGSRQPTAPTMAKDPLTGITPRVASLLCYVPMLGWIMGVIILATSHFREDRTTRFHAFQGIYLFVAWLVLDWFVKPIVHAMPGFHFGTAGADLLKLAIFIGWIFMLIKTSQNEVYRLPVIGELAERAVAEQG